MCLYHSYQVFVDTELPFKTFKLIFTSPSSADGDLNEPDNRAQRGKSTGTGPPKHANNAEIHGMNGSVTPRAMSHMR